MKQETLNSSQVKKLLTGRTIYVRCNDVRFLVTRSSFTNSLKNKDAKITVEYDNTMLLIESVSVGQF